ncbi:hypothetical protein BVG19_g4701 [[Candida] boidinii]|nr:hypothetical protein BVG19_g4701 [[Candida] boidinii]OWB52200.1 hypothetical protein B5S27_g3772 [[Candida] boidinii]OWB86350.1 hypothetical protein B5S33_g5037 [[Candida] boidinii]
MASTINKTPLIEWLRDPVNKTFWNEDLVSVMPSKFGGLGVFAKKYIDGGEEENDNVLLRIHKSCILSPKTSCISNLLYDANLSGMTALVIAFLYEKSQGEKSPWYDYINSINYYTDDEKKQYLVAPCLWEDNEKSLLIGTEAEILGITDPEEVERNFAISIQFAKDVKDILPIPFELSLEKGDNDENKNKFHLFTAITFAIVSRAFSVDRYHEIALVPAADLFNHDSYGRENVHFETVGDVCKYCGKYRDCDHVDSDNESIAAAEDDDDDDEEDEEGEGEDEDEEEEDEDDEKEGPKVKKAKIDTIESAEDNTDEEGSEGDDEDEDEDVDTEEGLMRFVQKLDEEIEQKSDDEIDSEDELPDDIDPHTLALIEEAENVDPDDCCYIVLVKPVKKGEEIFNAYGELSNSYLLAKYGFVADGNIYDSVCLGREILNDSKKFDSDLHLDWWVTGGGYDLISSYFQEEEDGCCADAGCADANCADAGCADANCGHEDGEESHHSGDHHKHKHSHSHTNNSDIEEDQHSEDGEDHDEHEDEEMDEEEEDSWLLESKISFPCTVAPCLVAISILFTMEKLDIVEMSQKDPDEIAQILSTPTEASKQKLQSWIEERLKKYNDGGMTSEEYEAVIKDMKFSNRLNASTLIKCEKQILEKALQDL